MDRFLTLALAWFAEHGAAAVTSIMETTRRQIQAIVATGITEGQNPREIARLLRQAWPEVARQRAENIAQTETLSALNAGASEGYRLASDELGLVLEKEWIATRDGRTRETHTAANGQRRPLAEPFTVGGHAAMQPGDPALPVEERARCRCAQRVHVVGRKASERYGERNAAMREAYPALRDRYGKAIAMERLGEEHVLSPRQVERIVYQTA